MIIHLVPRLPDYTSFYYARMGSFSLSTNAVKYIAFEDVVDYDGIQETSGAHYRRFLQTRIDRLPRRNAPDLDISYPYYAKATSIPSALYVDIRRAYQQIVKSFGMEVWYKEGKAIGYGETIPDTALFDVDKISRGLLVTGHNKESRYTLWQNGTLKTVSFSNQYFAPYLQRAIYRTLHAIMSKVKPLVFYAHTDGFIINHRMLPRIDKILTQYNFEYAIKDYGAASIKTTGTYKIGERETFNYARNKPRSSDYIVSDDRDDWWLKMYVQGIEKRAMLKS